MALNPFVEKITTKNYTSNSARISYNKSFLDGGYYHTPPIPAETQKARGIFFLMNKSAVVKAAFGWRIPKHLVFHAGEQFSDGSFNYPVFARPCPVDPRHGFVDSIPCKTAETLNALSLETLEEESDAELLVTKPIDASYSAILTDGVLTFSGGNDGATSGKNVKYFYINEDPIATAISLDPTLLLEGEVPFYEFVMDKNGANNLVQVRSAPGVPKCKDFVQDDVEVKTVIKAEGDLLEWETLMRTVDAATTIVDHRGGSLSSHYSIHAILNRVPLFTTYLPEIGDKLVPTVHNTEVNEEDKDSFFKSFCYGFSAGEHMMKKSQFFSDGSARTIMKTSLQLALSCLHNFSTIVQSKDYEVVGITLGLFLRATFTVSSGETRHVGSRLNSSHDADLHKWYKEIPKNRETCYNWVYKQSTSELLENIMVIYRMFDDVNWGSGYGGAKWASCTRSSIELFNACVTKDIGTVVALFNNVLHEEHNGGKYLNKVINVGEFDLAANDSSTYALKNMNVVIDLLSTVWEHAATVGDDNIPWEQFIAIDYESKKPKAKKASTEKPVGRWGITKARVYIDSKGHPTKIKVTGNKLDKKYTFPIEKLGVTINTMASCECCPSEKLDDWNTLLSVPYYWQIEDQTVISKSGLNALLDAKMGAKEVKVGKALKGSSAYYYASKKSDSSAKFPTAASKVVPKIDSTSVDLINQLKEMLSIQTNLNIGSATSGSVTSSGQSAFISAMSDADMAYELGKKIKTSEPKSKKQGKKNKQVFSELKVSKANAIAKKKK